MKRRVAWHNWVDVFLLPVCNRRLVWALGVGSTKGDCHLPAHFLSIISFKDGESFRSKAIDTGCIHQIDSKARKMVLHDTVARGEMGSFFRGNSYIFLFEHGKKSDLGRLITRTALMSIFLFRCFCLRPGKAYPLRT